MPCPVLSCHALSCHVMSCHVMSCHVLACCVSSCLFPSPSWATLLIFILPRPQLRAELSCVEMWGDVMCSYLWMNEERRQERREESIVRDRLPYLSSREGKWMGDEGRRGDKSTLYLSTLPLPSHLLMAAFRVLEKGTASGLETCLQSPPLPSYTILSYPLTSPLDPSSPLLSPPVRSHPPSDSTCPIVFLLFPIFVWNLMYLNQPTSERKLPSISSTLTWLRAGRKSIRPFTTP